MGWAVPDVLLTVEVVAKHPPARARELQGQDGNEEHPDKRVHGQERPELEERRPLDREEQQQEGTHDRRQVLVGGAPADKESLDPIHGRSESTSG